MRPQWAEVVEPDPPHARAGSTWAAWSAPFVAAVVLGLVGFATLAAAVFLTAVALAVLRVLWPGGAHTIDRGFAVVGRVVGAALRVGLLAVVELFVLAPLALLAFLVRHDPLTVGARSRAGRWQVHSTPPPVLRRRTYLAESPENRTRGAVSRVATPALRVVGLALLLLVANYAAGWTWDELAGTHDTPLGVAAASSIDELRVAPAMAHHDWSSDYWLEFEELEYEFRPFIMSRIVDVDGRYITSEAGIRRSFEPAGLTESSPEVWFFGGAALWGQGQRDLHTVPSQIARLAEAAGTPIRVVNFGQPGYTSWQSALLLEQELAVREPPDAVVFYEGADDVAVQLEAPSEDPTHYNVPGAQPALLGRDSAQDQLREWWQEYRDASLVNAVLEGVPNVFGAQAAVADRSGLEERVLDLRARSVDLAAFVAERHGVEAVFAWQAAEGVPSDEGAYRRVAAIGTAGAGDPVDLSGVLDDADTPVFLDGVLVNEQGASLVAPAVWALIEPLIG